MYFEAFAQKKDKNNCKLLLPKERVKQQKFSIKNFTNLFAFAGCMNV